MFYLNLLYETFEKSLIAGAGSPLYGSWSANLQVCQKNFKFFGGPGVKLKLYIPAVLPKSSTFSEISSLF